ncbi:unnamed protein product [Amoebophrya sp. A25]|nr:unnamed protein product [Amoebophrya sp. A25]|eukprot:GSA25T00007441001.1
MVQVALLLETLRSASFWTGIIVALVTVQLLPMLFRSFSSGAAKRTTEVLAAASRISEELKMVLVVRQDLGMQKGKIAAQCGHAVLGAYQKAMSSEAGRGRVRQWERFGQAKIALKCNTEEEMQNLERSAKKQGLCTYVVHDAGRTQIAAGSATVLAVGPAPASQVDQVTGGLKLL